MQESKHFCTCYLIKFLIGLSGIWYSVQICYSDEPYTLYLHQSVFKGENHLAHSLESNQKNSL